MIAEGRYLDVKKDQKITFGELIQKYKENYQHQSSFKNGKELYVKNFEEYFKSKTMLNRFRYVDLVTYRNNLRQKLNLRMIRTTAAVDRELACLHHLFSEAKAWGMIEGNPFTEGKTLIEKENNARLRFLSEEEIPRLLDSCSPSAPSRHCYLCLKYRNEKRRNFKPSVGSDQKRFDLSAKDEDKHEPANTNQ